jgi:alcohol dehydrogenase YqhD (iron-dependent ADH family)
VKNFRVVFGTLVRVGPGEFAGLGRESSRIGKRALLVGYKAGTGPDDILERGKKYLTAAGVEFVPFAEVEPNPRHSVCDEGAALFLESGCDHIVAVGGGSVIDSAKAVSAAAANGGSCWDYARRPGGRAEIKRAIPILAVPTTAATGSEANPEAVISNRETREKCVIVGPPLLTPKTAILDPELHLTLPKSVTADGCIDIISHCLDCYLSGHDDCGVQDSFAEGIINTVLEWGPIAYHDGRNLRARRELLYSAVLAVSDMTLAGRGGTWLIHNIEHALSAYYDVSHGQGIAVVMPRVLRYLKPHIARRLAQLGRRCFGVTEAEEGAAAEQTIERFKTWLGRMDRNLTLGQLEIGDENFSSMADHVVVNDGDGSVYHSVVDLGREEVIEILNLCL